MLFCSISKTSNKAEAGSPLKSLQSLSISSNRITGLLIPACFTAEIIRPGIEPTYVLRCPTISDSSRTPPKEIRSNSKPIACAMDFAMELLPTPGGPTKQMTCPFI